MKILLATPLYPPDVAWPSPYIKELAQRLSPAHEISIATYGRLPEKVAGVHIETTDKRLPLAVRLMHYTLMLMRMARKADILYAENGASVELPLIITSLVTRTPIVLHAGDERARARASHSRLLGALEDTAASRAKKVLADSPLPKPEILPFAPYPTNEFAAYEASWNKHLEEIGDIFTYARQ